MQTITTTCKYITHYKIYQSLANKNDQLQENIIFTTYTQRKREKMGVVFDDVIKVKIRK